jgi:uncharacterized protein YkwD
VAIGRRAYTAIRRHLLQAIVCAALFALCIGCCVAASTAPAATLKRTAKGASSHTSHPAPHRRRRCARGASFHTIGKPGASGKKAHHRKRHAGCRRRHAKRHRRVVHHAHHAPVLNAYSPAPIPQNGVCPNTQMRPSGADLELIRTATLCLINRERLSHGEGALRPDAQLQAAAQGHSQDMAAGDYFDHDGPGGSTPLSRMRAAGYIFSSHIGYAVGENIAWATLGLSTPQAIVSGWMNSSGHRANILDSTFRDTGLGISPHPLASLARGQTGAIYTQDFGRIITP